LVAAEEEESADNFQFISGRGEEGKRRRGEEAKRGRGEEAKGWNSKMISGFAQNNALFGRRQVAGIIRLFCSSFEPRASSLEASAPK
jgi:hypothetical protein